MCWRSASAAIQDCSSPARSIMSAPSIFPALPCCGRVECSAFSAISMRRNACLRWTIGGGEKTPEARIRAFSQYFTNARYIDAYGLTETCGGDTFMEPGLEIAKIGSTGRPVAHVEIEIRDDAGNRLAPGDNGEICLRGPKVTPGYWKDPGKTAAAFFGDWFRSGDVGYR